MGGWFVGWLAGWLVGGLVGGGGDGVITKFNTFFKLDFIVFFCFVDSRSQLLSSLPSREKRNRNNLLMLEIRNDVQCIQGLK